MAMLKMIMCILDISAVSILIIITNRGHFCGIVVKPFTLCLRGHEIEVMVSEIWPQLLAPVKAKIRNIDEKIVAHLKKRHKLFLSVIHKNVHRSFSDLLLTFFRNIDFLHIAVSTALCLNSERCLVVWLLRYYCTFSNDKLRYFCFNLLATNSSIVLRE